ncbi:GerAB/ArcD/ProY family transporter [Peribacillus sp. SI8-4]|uniref:GerAB/ArcD/ProY family transporter n=1 Tax=Peribacillus sp. SI8-4 TaxID=3048009 RepID=UPI002555A490|nr:GerAB/ArcD/ProY family transporter [Peribacillus sp. SI8-4]
MTQRIQIGAVFIIIHLSFGYVVYPNLIYMLTKTAHWEVIICQGLLQLILIWIYMKGLNYFPAQNVTDIFLKMGRWAAIIFLTPFAINLIALASLNIRIHTEVIISIFLPRTPYWAILILLFFISVYTALKGLGTILRSAIFIFLFVIPLVVLNIFSSVINFNIHNVTPGLNFPPKFLLDIKFFYLLGFSSFIFLGFITSKTKLIFRQLLAVWVIVTVLFLAIVYIPLFIFGQDTVVTLKNPFLEAMDSIDISWFSFNRQAIFFGVLLVGLVILTNSVLFWLIGTIMQKIYRWNSSNWIIAFSFIALLIALVVPNKSLLEKYFLWSSGAQALFMIIIPLALFIYGFWSNGGVRGHEKQ